MPRLGGVLFFKIDGTQYKAKGSFTYNLGTNKKEMIAGMDSVHGYKEIPQVPYIEGSISDDEDLDLKALTSLSDSLITLQLANNKVIQLNNAVYASDGNVTTEEGEIEVRFEGMSAHEVA